MLLSFAHKIFGSANDRLIKKLSKVVDKINALEPTLTDLSDDELRARTEWMRQRLSDGETLDDILVDAFATVREASKRTIGLRHFDVQLIGGIVLHQGMITEMKTGEGKTLVATLAVYLNALTKKGVHVVTVNDYLARRDATWMGQIYRFLGMSVGCILNNMDDPERREAYQCDITYGTNNEFGFDYLRDNMKFRLEDMVQRPFYYAIVDEVDSILIDEARTPLIISGPAETSSNLYVEVDQLIPRLEPSHYEKDEKRRTVTLTETGTERIEELLREADLLKTDNLYHLQNIALVQHVNQALRAHILFKKDVDYIVKDKKVIIIDEFTGRMMEGRRYSDGLHQALEAKEHVPIQLENQTLASITFQNFFRLYEKLSGMTGTAQTEAAEFSDIYGLEVISIPTHRAVQRKDHDDEIYRTAHEKYESILKLIQECRQRKQPLLVGTVSIEKSELLSNLLQKNRISHQVLNARYHEQEAIIISQAGTPGAITIATNMAGRGTDIQLGGNLEMRLAQELASISDEDARRKRETEIRAEVIRDAEIVREAGGLYVIGTERHESRRIDNQLRGRSGRQGDPGASKFFLSLEDDLMRIFGSDRLDKMLVKLGLEEGEAITHRWINKALERAQRKVEAMHYDIRKHLLKYDNVMNDQRKVIYEQRRELMSEIDISDAVQEFKDDVIYKMVNQFIPKDSYTEQWDTEGLEKEIHRLFGFSLPLSQWMTEDGIQGEEVRRRIVSRFDQLMSQKTENYGLEPLQWSQKTLLLRILDQAWKDHLLSLDHLRQGINLRAYAQKDPLNEYKREAFNLFHVMLDYVKEEFIIAISHFELSQKFLFGEDADGLQEEIDFSQTQAIHPSFNEQDQEDPFSLPETLNLPHTTDPKVRRNDPCPCGSGQKYKNCHGKL